MTDIKRVFYENYDSVISTILFISVIRKAHDRIDLTSCINQDNDSHPGISTSKNHYSNHIYYDNSENKDRIHCLGY